MRTPPADGLALTLTLDAATVAAIAETAAELALARLTAEQANPTPWMTLPEVCAYLRWSKDRVYKLTSARAIPHIKQEGRLLFNRTELDRWLAAHHQGPRLPDIA